jgi:hypothetical protein
VIAPAISKAITGGEDGRNGGEGVRDDSERLDGMMMGLQHQGQCVMGRWDNSPGSLATSTVREWRKCAGCWENNDIDGDMLWPMLGLERQWRSDGGAGANAWIVMLMREWLGGG